MLEETQKERGLEIIFKNWTSLVQPKPLQFERGSLSRSYGKFIMEPLEKGFGITMGHALRRILLSSLRGSAVYAIQIEGVSHEFCHIPGVVEDVVQIILNLKELQIEQFTEEDIEMELSGQGLCSLKGKDIITFEKARILNPEQPIATLEKSGSLSMKIFAKYNKGYISSEENQDSELPVGSIFLDSNHSPIIRINYEVENARVEQRTDYDRLIFELWTDNSKKPEHCLAYAAKIIKEHMNVFINFDEQSTEYDQDQNEQERVPNEKLYLPVTELELSVRSINCLQKSGIETIGELVQKDEAELLRTKNFGRKSLNEIKKILLDMGFSLGTRLENFDPKNNPYQLTQSIS